MHILFLRRMILTKKVCVVIASRANYGRIKTAMKAIQEHPELSLQLIVGASTLLTRFGKAIDVIKKDGFQVDSEIHYVVEGENLITQAKTTGLGIIELATSFQRLAPDFVLTVADRFETMATAISATYMNIPLIHVQGGELSGNIDDRVRHAITKLADIHFVCTEASEERLINMGEASECIYNTGCPSIDVALGTDLTINNSVMRGYYGTGDLIDWEKPYLLLVQHPDTTTYGSGTKQILSSLNALKSFSNYQKIVLWPNIDAGSDEISKGIRLFREDKKNNGLLFHYYRNFSPEDYIRVLANASCCLGNSSSFIRDGDALGIPAVIVGDRQKNREIGKNVVFSDYSESTICKLIQKQLDHGNYSPSSRYGRGNAGTKIAEIIPSLIVGRHKKQMI